MLDTTKYLFMITGSPGSGKSTLAANIMTYSADARNISPVAGICEADDYFYISSGGKRYEFNPALLGKAHAWCQNKAMGLMRVGKNLVVSNTSITPRDRKPYFDMAKEYGYKVVFIHLDDNHGSIHNVPEDVISRMNRNYIGPTEYEASLIFDSMTDGLGEVLRLSRVTCFWHDFL